MKTEKIKVMGEELNVGYNMAVQIAYEEIIHEPFDASKLQMTRNMVVLCFASIITMNPECQMDIKTFMAELSANEYQQLSTAVVKALTEWCNIPMDEDKSEDTGKN